MLVSSANLVSVETIAAFREPGQAESTMAPALRALLAALRMLLWPRAALSLPTIMTQAVSHDHDPGSRGLFDS